MVMNVSANLLGLGNAATPFGIEAMRRLDELNPRPGIASDAQALFCALNTASLQLVPATVIALRAAAGARSARQTSSVPTLLATACAAVTAVALGAAPRAALPPRAPSTGASPRARAGRGPLDLDHPALVVATSRWCAPGAA